MYMINKIMRLTIFTISIFLFLANLVIAKPINELIVKGNERISSETIKVFSGFNKGDDINQNDLNDIIKSLYETVLVTANDELVHLFLDGKINFLDIVKKLSMIMKLKEFSRYKYINPKNFDQIKNLSTYVRLKVKNLCI